jgi:hypothetical protein
MQKGGGNEISYFIGSPMCGGDFYSSIFDCGTTGSNSAHTFHFPP